MTNSRKAFVTQEMNQPHNKGTSVKQPVPA